MTLLWTVPTLVTIVTFGYAIKFQSDYDDHSPNIVNVILLIPAGLISLLAWVIYTVFK